MILDDLPDVNNAAEIELYPDGAIKRIVYRHPTNITINGSAAINVGGEQADDEAEDDYDEDDE